LGRKTGAAIVHLHCTFVTNLDPIGWLTALTANNLYAGHTKNLVKWSRRRLLKLTHSKKLHTALFARKMTIAGNVMLEAYCTNNGVLFHFIL